MLNIYECDILEAIDVLTHSYLAGKNRQANTPENVYLRVERHERKEKLWIQPY